MCEQLRGGQDSKQRTKKRARKSRVARGLVWIVILVIEVETLRSRARREMDDGRTGAKTGQDKTRKGRGRKGNKRKPFEKRKQERKETEEIKKERKNKNKIKMKGEAE